MSPAHHSFLGCYNVVNRNWRREDSIPFQIIDTQCLNQIRSPNQFKNFLVDFNRWNLKPHAQEFDRSVFEDGRPGIEYKQNCMQSDTTRLKGGPETGLKTGHSLPSSLHFESVEANTGERLGQRDKQYVVPPCNAISFSHKRNEVLIHALI